MKIASAEISGGRISARERLLGAADKLFYEFGINNVGIERVIETAGVAKASLYDCFGSKEELARSYVQARDERRRDRVMSRLTGLKTPRDKVLAVFDLLAEIAGKPDFRGCAFNRAGAESMPGSKVREACEHAREWMFVLFDGLAKEAGAATPTDLARSLALLYDGATIAAHFAGSTEAVAAARNSADLLMRSVETPSRRRRAGLAGAVARAEA
jgi:AcrR family transcriptional regulator